MKVGFVGLGIMGRPMAHNLMKGGHELFVFGKRTVPPEIREGATVCDTLKSVAERSDVIIIMVGDVGAGQTTKVANQIIVALTIEAVGEALLFASKAGADPAKVRQALMGGFASSRILEVHGERMIKRTFDPGFRIELHQKDLS